MNETDVFAIDYTLTHWEDRVEDAGRIQQKMRDMGKPYHIGCSTFGVCGDSSCAWVVAGGGHCNGIRGKEGIILSTHGDYIMPGPWMTSEELEEDERLERNTRLPLAVLMNRHGTDKLFYHHYEGEYERHFAPLRDQSLSILEIGVGGFDHP